MYFMLRRRASDVARKTAELEKAKRSLSYTERSSTEEPAEENEEESDNSCSLSRRGTIPLTRATMSNTREVPCSMFAKLETKTKFDSKDCKITGISFSRGGDLLVSDANNNKVKMFDLQGHLRIECTILPEYGKLKWPVGVCGLSTGEIVVADRDDDDIKVFTSEGRYLMSFGKGLEKPSVMTSTGTKQVIFLEEKSGNVYIYNAMTEDHTFLHGADKKHVTFDASSGIAYANETIVISKRTSNQLVLFNTHGQLVSTYDCSKGRHDVADDSGNIKIKQPVSIATDRDSHVLILDTDRLLSFDLKKKSFKPILDLAGTPVKNAAGVATSHNGFIAIYTADGSTVYIFKYFEKL